jgi:EAL domain-containing protein (putative c-di-GMP-specific phosphodiesterase class I)/CheY-like chemotaxis protein
MTFDPGSAREPVLVVDDDIGVRRLVAVGLRRAEFEVLEAETGEAALGLVESTPVGIVVSDLNMPGMSGIELVRLLRSRSATSTLPIILMSGTGDEDSLVKGLDAGANDFLAKPVRIDELVARVGAHMRSSATWSAIIQDELGRRSAVVEALGRLPVGHGPEESAGAILAEIARSTAFDFLGVLQLVSGDRMVELASYVPDAGVQFGGALLGPNLSRDLAQHARRGPWVEDVVTLTDDARTPVFAAADLAIVARAPIYAGDQLVGLLTVGLGEESGRRSPARKAGLLAAAIDYASFLSAGTGAAFADRRGMADDRATLEQILVTRAFHPVFQPIVDLATRRVVGYEALTRFADGIRPDLRFAKATSIGLGHELELAAVTAALDAVPGLPADIYVSLNMSPSLLLSNGDAVRSRIRSAPRRLVIELTEHVAIEDYQALRAAIAELGDIGVAVDDAGAGYASLRHILELGPTFAKLDTSLVRGIDADELRQSLAAGLVYFAVRSGCRLIAEGVESEAEAGVLHQLGVEFAQGYLFGHPEPIGG